MCGRKKVEKAEQEHEEIDGYRLPDQKSLIDMSWVVYVGMQIGYTEEQISHMYYKKWKALYKQFQKHHNMIVKKLTYQGA